MIALSYAIDLTVVVSIIASVGLRWLPQQMWRVGAALIVLGLLFIPIKALFVHEYIRAFTDHFSLASFLVAIIGLKTRLLGKKVADRRQLGAFSLVIVIAGVILYTSNLGGTQTDIYQWGYHNILLFMFIFLVGLAAWYYHLWVIFFWLLLSFACFQAGFFPAQNIWDYLIDPWIVVYSLAHLIYLSYFAFKRYGRHLYD